MPHYERDGIVSHLLVAETTVGAKHLTTSLVEMRPGGRQHIHSHETEQCYFILEGVGEMTVGNETSSITVGNCIFIPSNVTHGLVNTGKGILRYYSAGSPPFSAELEASLWPLNG